MKNSSNISIIIINHHGNDTDTMGVSHDNVNHNCELNITDQLMSCNKMRIMCESILSENDYASDID